MSASQNPESIVISYSQDRLAIGPDGTPKRVSEFREGTKDRTAERLRVLGYIIKYQTTRPQFLVSTAWRDSGQDPKEFAGSVNEGTKNWVRRLQTGNGERLILEDKIQNLNVMRVNPNFRMLPDLALAQTFESLYADVGKTWSEL